MNSPMADVSSALWLDPIKADKLALEAQTMSLF